MNTLHNTQPEYIQGSAEWLALRKTKITATDASILMGASHWKTRTQLYHEKMGTAQPTYVNAAMQRGLDLEPIARSLFNLMTGLDVQPRVIVSDWQMASLDGISDNGSDLVEIKCAGAADHALAVAGKIPAHYYPQLQHQMMVADVRDMFYFSFDGADGVIVEVARDDAYIAKLIDAEWEFYQCMLSCTPPTPLETDYIERDDELWLQCASKWKEVSSQIKSLEKEESELRKQLIFLSGESSTKGGGISLCQVSRKGNVDYSAIPELKSVDLEMYRKPDSSYWRLT